MDQPSTNSSGADSHLMAALSYVWILSVVMLITKRGDSFVQFHARQALILFVVSLAAMVIAPFVFIVGPLLCLVVIIFEIFGFTKALSGERYVLPGLRWTVRDRIQQ